MSGKEEVSGMRDTRAIKAVVNKLRREIRRWEGKRGKKRLVACLRSDLYVLSRALRRLNMWKEWEKL